MIYVILAKFIPGTRTVQPRLFVPPRSSATIFAVENPGDQHKRIFAWFFPFFLPRKGQKRIDSIGKQGATLKLADSPLWLEVDGKIEQRTDGNEVATTKPQRSVAGTMSFPSSFLLPSSPRFNSLPACWYFQSSSHVVLRSLKFSINSNIVAVSRRRIYSSSSRSSMSLNRVVRWGFPLGSSQNPGLFN